MLCYDNIIVIVIKSDKHVYGAQCYKLIIKLGVNYKGNVGFIFIIQRRLNVIKYVMCLILGIGGIHVGCIPVDFLRVSPDTLENMVQIAIYIIQWAFGTFSIATIPLLEYWACTPMVLFWVVIALIPSDIYIYLYYIYACPLAVAC